MRGAPQVGFSATMRKMSSRSSAPIRLRPGLIRCRESQAQYALNPARCQRTTVSGWTRINACFHPNQNRLSTTQNSRSKIANRGCGCLCFKTASCCRSAGFSKSRSRRERKSWVTRIDRSLSKCSMRSVYRASAQVGPTSHLTDLKIDRYFGEAQPPTDSLDNL